MTLKLCWTPQASPPLPLPLLILSPGSKMSQGEGNFVRSCSFETLLRLEMKVDSGSVSYHSQQQQNLSGMTTYLGIRDKVTGKTRLTSQLFSSDQTKYQADWDQLSRAKTKCCLSQNHESHTSSWGADQKPQTRSLTRAFYFYRLLEKMSPMLKEWKPQNISSSPLANRKDLGSIQFAYPKSVQCNIFILYPCELPGSTSSRRGCELTAVRLTKEPARLPWQLTLI